MVRADVMRMIITCGVVAIILSVPQLPLRSAPHGYIFGLAALAMMLGTAEVLRDNAAQTVLPSIVAKSDLEAANGQLWSIEEIMGSFVGPPLAGVLIAVAVPIPFVFDAVTFALAAWLVWLIVLPPRIAPPHGKILDDIAAGWAWMRANPVILRLAIMLGRRDWRVLRPLDRRALWRPNQRLRRPLGYDGSVYCNCRNTGGVGLCDGVAGRHVRRGVVERRHRILQAAPHSG